MFKYQQLIGSKVYENFACFNWLISVQNDIAYSVIWVCEYINEASVAAEVVNEVTSEDSVDVVIGKTVSINCRTHFVCQYFVSLFS